MKFYKDKKVPNKYYVIIDDICITIPIEDGKRTDMFQANRHVYWWRSIRYQYMQEISPLEVLIMTGDVPSREDILMVIKNESL